MGQTDIELNASGIKQAEYLRQRLATEKIDAVYSSSLKRAMVTAGAIADGRGLKVIACPELVEVDFGEVEGLTFEEVSQLHPELAKELANWSIQLRFPGGESFEEFNTRVTKFMEILTRHKAEETVLIVSHFGTLRLLICNLMGLDRRHWRQIRLDLGSLSIVQTYPQVAILSLLNDVCHLHSVEKS